MADTEKFDHDAAAVGTVMFGPMGAVLGAAKENAVANPSDYREPVSQATKSFGFVVEGADLLRYEGTESILLLPRVSVIKELAFFGNKDISEVTIQEPTIEIGDNAFRACENMHKVQLPKSLITIGKNAFASCECLREVVLPEGLIEIKSEAFSLCKRLKSIAIPKSVKFIGAKAFAACTELEKIELPDSTEVSADAFEWCEKAKITIVKTGTPCTVTATENSKRIWCEEIMLDDFQAAFDQHTQKLSQNPNDWRANLFMCFMNCRAYKYAEPEFNLAISQLEKACKSIEGDLSIPEESRQYFKHKGVLELYNSISDYIVKLDAKREDMNGTRIIRVFHVKDRTYLENILDKMQECLPICQRILDLIISDNYSTNSKDFNEIINATAINIMGLCDALRMIAQEVMQTDIMKQ